MSLFSSPLPVSHMWHELSHQGSAWQAALSQLSQKKQVLNTYTAPHQLMSQTESLSYPSSVGSQALLIGAGSSYYLACAAQGAWLRKGWHARAIPSSEMLLYPHHYIPQPQSLAIAISRSGTTTETLRALEHLKARGYTTFTITTVPDSPMSQLADISVAVPEAAEKSVVQTRSFSTQYLIANLLPQLEQVDTAQQLPELQHTWFARCQQGLSRLPAYTRVFFLGTGDRWGLAMEGALKMKETALTEAEAFQTLEFRHGPISMVDDKTLVVALISNDHQQAELAVLDAAQQHGAFTLAVGEALSPEWASLTLNMDSDLPETLASVMMLTPLQVMAYTRAIAKGLDPDTPRHLSFAVHLPTTDIPSTQLPPLMD